MNPSPATRNVIALVTACHHEHDDVAADLVAGMDETERIATLVNAVGALTERYEVDAHELGVSFDEYIQAIAAATEHRATELGL